MRDIASARNKTVAQVAINYVISKGVIPIPGARNAKMVRERERERERKRESARAETGGGSARVFVRERERGAERASFRVRMLV